MIYLDNAATTQQKPPEVTKAVQNALNTFGGAGRGGHKAAMLAADALFACREEAAELFDMPGPELVVLTMNATHGLNVAIKSLAKPGTRVLVSGMEHNAVTRPLFELEKTGVRTVRVHTPLFEPQVAIRSFQENLDSGVSLVVCNHVSNVFGYVLPIEEIGQMCREYGVPFLVDASQSAGCLPIRASQMPGTTWCMPGHKGLYGPQGTGLILVSSIYPLSPLIEGGTGSLSLSLEMPDFLPDRLEAGTQNAPGAAGLCEGLRFVRRKGVDAILKDECEKCRLLEELLAGEPRIHLFSDQTRSCQTGVLSLTVDGWSTEELGQVLAERDVCVRAGLHCSPFAHQTAETYPDGTVRFSASAFTTTRDIRAAAAVLLKVTKMR